MDRIVGVLRKPTFGLVLLASLSVLACEDGNDPVGPSEGDDPATL